EWQRSTECEAGANKFEDVLREMYLRIAVQPSSCLYLDVPMYIRMSRLDEMKRAQHTGRRKLKSHFAKDQMNWLDVHRTATIGLADMDLGYDPSSLAEYF